MYESYLTCKIEISLSPSNRKYTELAGFDNIPPFSPLSKVEKRKENTEDSIFVTTETLHSKKINKKQLS